MIALHHATDSTKLRTIYFMRAAFAGAWAAAALSLSPAATTWAVVLLLIYPLWDAAANIVDAHGRTGPGADLARLNVAVSAAAVVGVMLALRSPAVPVLLVFGLWAVASGILQLAVGAVRRKSIGGQWPMMLSGLQSALIGGVFIARSSKIEGQPRDVAVYAAFGAAYFLLSALLLRRGSIPKG